MYFAIPSKKRSHILEQHTLPFLYRHNIPKEDIYIFVSSHKDEIEDDYLEYLNKFCEYNVIMAEDGIAGVHNFITNYFDEGEQIILIDDDIEDLKHIEDFDTDLKQVLLKAFTTLKRTGKRYFGFYAFKWEREQKRLKYATEGLCYILGCLVGVINDKTCIIPAAVQYKEDVFRVLHFYKNSGTIRYNKFYIKTKYYRKDGGLATTRTNENEKDSANALAALYPEYISAYQKKDKTQFRFNRKL